MSGEKGFFEKLMDTAENTMDGVEKALAPVGEEEGENSFRWRSANADGVWVFHAFQGNRPLCGKEISIIGDQSLRGGHADACCKCMRMVQEMMEEE